MTPGQQLSQCVHGMRQFSDDHPDVDTAWYKQSNYLAILSVADEQGLLALIDKASRKGVKFSIFFEPDLKYAVTSVVLEPGKESKRLCSSIGLALKEKK